MIVKSILRCIYGENVYVLCKKDWIFWLVKRDYSIVCQKCLCLVQKGLDFCQRGLYCVGAKNVYIFCKKDWIFCQKGLYCLPKMFVLYKKDQIFFKGTILFGKKCLCFVRKGSEFFQRGLNCVPKIHLLFAIRIGFFVKKGLYLCANVCVFCKKDWIFGYTHRGLFCVQKMFVLCAKRIGLFLLKMGLLYIVCQKFSRYLPKIVFVQIG